MPQRRVTTHTLPDIVPMLVGHVPSESVVLVFLADGRVVVTARVDLAAVRQPDGAARLAATCSHRSDRATYDSVITLVYASDPSGVLPASDAAVEAVRVVVAQSFWVRPDGRWTDLATAETGWVDYGQIPDDLRWRALSTRDEIARIVAGPAVDETVDVDQLQAVDPDVWDHPHHLTHDEALATAGALTDDVVFADVVARLTSEQSAAWVELAKSVVAQVPASLAERPLIVLGLAGWADGDGVLVNLAVDRLITLGSTSPLVTLLVASAERALPPSVWESCRARLVTAATERN